MNKLAICIIMAVMLVPGASRAANAVVQAEAFSGSRDLGYDPIRSYLGILEGLDYPGEWTEYRLPVLPYGTYQVNMRCWGATVPYRVQLVTYPVQGEEPRTIEFNFVGKGAACT